METMEIVKAIAGCAECFGSSIRWIGRNAMKMAAVHATETGHAIWGGEMHGPKRVLKVPSEPRTVKKALTPMPTALTPSLPKARLSKRNMCDGKVAHRSPAAAQKAIDKAPWDRQFLNFYQCLYCGKYHVGHIIKPKSTKK